MVRIIMARTKQSIMKQRREIAVKTPKKSHIVKVARKMAMIAPVAIKRPKRYRLIVKTLLPIM